MIKFAWFRLTVLVGLALLFAVFSTPAGADDRPVNGIITVSKDGKSDFTRIQEAIAFSKAGEIIEICDEEAYNEDIDLSSYHRRTLRAGDGKHPIIDGRMKIGEGCVVEGLIIRPTDQCDSALVIANKAGNEWTIRDCEISGEKIDRKKYDIAGINVNGSRDAKIISCHIHHTFYPAVWVEGGARNVLIKGNVIHHTQGICMRGSYGTKDVKIISNTIYKNTYAGIFTVTAELASEIKNNIIVNNRYGILGGGAGQMSHNNVWGNKVNYKGGISAGKDDISADPLFADPANLDLHLKSRAGRWDAKAGKWVKDAATSPCIDAGDPKADFSSEPNGSRVNMGAFGGTRYASMSAGKVNVAPSKPEIALLLPPSPGPSPVIVCKITKQGLDPNGDKVKYTYRWSRNGRIEAGLTTETVPANRVKSGDFWRCEVTASDGSLISLSAAAEVRCRGKSGRPDYRALRKKYCWIQSKIDSLPATGGVVEIPAGEHVIYNTIRIDRRKNIKVIGKGSGKTYIKPATKGVDIFGAKYSEGIKISGMKIDGGINWFEVSDSEISNIKIDIRTMITGNTCHKSVIRDNELTKAHIIFFSSDHMEVLNNTIRKAYWHGIDLNSGNTHWKVSGNKIYSSLGIHIYSASNHNEITDNYLYNCVGGIWIVYSSSHNVIKGNVIKKTRDKNPGIIICELDGRAHCKENAITYNVIFNGADRGIACVPARKRRAGVSGSHHTYIYNNIIYGNAGDGIDWIKGWGINQAVIKNNIIVNNGGYGITGNAKLTFITSEYNNIHNNKSGHYNNCIGKNDLHVVPIFADAVGGDFHLKSQAGRWDAKTKKWVKDKVSSPCIDAGDPKANFFREPAPNGEKINMGAYGNTTEASKSTKEQK